MSSKRERQRRFHHEEFLTKQVEAKLIRAQYAEHFRKQKEIAKRLVAESGGQYADAVAAAQRVIANRREVKSKAQSAYLKCSEDQRHDVFSAYIFACGSLGEAEGDLDVLRDWWRREGEKEAAEAEKGKPSEVVEAEKNLKRKRMELAKARTDLGASEERCDKKRRDYKHYKRLWMDAIAHAEEAEEDAETAAEELEAARKRVKKTVDE